MKRLINSVLVLAIIIGSTAFTNPVTERKDITQSSITWKGKKILGSHTGTIDLKEGYLEMDGDKLVGGKFVVDMTTIKNSDLKEESRAKLEGHLRSEDFFAVEEFPEATLVITEAKRQDNTYKAMGDLTIKGITHPIEFELEMGRSGARTSVKIDRTKYGIQYGSGSFFDNLGDNSISNKFELDVILMF